MIEFFLVFLRFCLVFASFCYVFLCFFILVTLTTLPILVTLSSLRRGLHWTSRDPPPSLRYWDVGYSGNAADSKAVRQDQGRRQRKPSKT